MNHKEHVLGELELSEAHAREALQFLCHSIIFLRAPNSIRPKEVHCEHFQLSYAKCDWSASGLLPHRFDEKVDHAIDACLASLTQAAPELRKGRLTLTFFEKRRTTGFFGLVQTEEKVVFEEWALPVLIDVTPTNTSSSSSSSPQKQLGNSGTLAGRHQQQHHHHDAATVVERARVQDKAEALLRQRVVEVFALINGNIDHIPPVTYQFELSYGSKRDRGQDLATKIRNSPGLIHHPI